MRTPMMLVVDNDPAARQSVCDSLAAEGLTATTAGADDAIAMVKRQRVDAMFTGLQLDGRDGLSLIREVRRHRPGMAVVLMAGHGSLQSAIEALHLGVTDYLLKPVTAQAVSVALARVMASLRAQSQSSHDRSDRDASCESPPCKIVAISQCMRDVVALAGRAAKTDMPLLIEGETGVGKQLLARAIHQASSRARGPFVRIVAASIREEQFEAVLFGFEQGGQVVPGMLERARGGTLYLQHLSELPMWVQGRLAEALQQGWFLHAQGESRVPLETRVIAGTTSDVAQSLAEGKLLRPLYYQLSVLPIVIPPLRMRKEDIVPLTSHFLSQLTTGGRPPHRILRFSKEALALLSQYHWPGNVQELWNTVRRTTLVARGEEITTAELDDLQGTASSTEQDSGSLIRVPLLGDLKSMERYIVGEVIKTCHGNKAAAARLLGLHRRTLYRILQAAERSNELLRN